MADLTALRVTSPYRIESILSLEFSVLPNEHARLFLTGITNAEAGFSPLEKAGAKDVFELYETDSDGKKRTLFLGFPRNISVSRKSGVFMIGIEVLSGSVELDEERKSASFQNTRTTYDEIAASVIGDKQILFHKAHNKSIEVPAIRYRETAWGFLARMASRENTALYPDIKTSNLHFGLPKSVKNPWEIPKGSAYTARKDRRAYFRAKAAGADLREADFLCYEISSKEICFAGDRVLFERNPLRVTAFSAKLTDGDLIYTYTLASEESLWREKMHAPLKGVSLEGTVLETRGELLKLHLDIDEAQDKEKAYPYPYAPITGNAMYAMPIVGTKANLYFPDGAEEKAFAQDTVRTNGETCPNTANPDMRYFRTEHGAEIMMAPESLRFKDTKPSTGGRLFFELDDASGVKISSHKSLSLGAAGAISLYAGGSVAFSAPSNILFTQAKTTESPDGQSFTVPEATISLENETHVKAARTDYNGLSRMAYAAFPNALTAARAPARSFGSVRSSEKANAGEKKGFNWGALLVAVVAVAVAVVAVVALGPVAGLVIAGSAVASRALAGAVVGAAIAIADTAVIDAVNGTNSGLGTYIGRALTGALTGAIMGPELKVAGLIAGTLLRHGNELIVEPVKNIVYDAEEQLLSMFRSAENKSVAISKDNPVQTFETYKKDYKPDAEDDEYIAAIYLMDKWGASGMGHAAVALLKGDGSMEVFSFAGDPNKKLSIIAGNPSDGQLIHNDTYFDTLVYNGEKILMDNKFTNGENEKEKEKEQYTNFIWIDVTNEQGMKMKAFADTVDLNTPNYILYILNCNYMAQRILAAGGLNFSETEGDPSGEATLFSLNGLIPEGESLEEVLSYTIPGQQLRNKVGQLTEAFMEDIEQGTIPRAVYDEATSTGHVPNIRVFGEIKENKEAQSEVGEISEGEETQGGEGRRGRGGGRR